MNATGHVVGGPVFRVAARMGLPLEGAPDGWIALLRSCGAGVIWQPRCRVCGLTLLPMVRHHAPTDRWFGFLVDRAALMHRQGVSLDRALLECDLMLPPVLACFQCGSLNRLDDPHAQDGHGGPAA